ncbi:hypothetical protein CCH79_00009880 [Gambusia affinis]|uniref:Uncharacterized protein n=1 Tax=Gambusia affinis TaxID=33528 RepID=A0A315V578_GAMAF|nr:hypothetical protein CCH79_00009880 [Gambusia affinis]
MLNILPRRQSSNECLKSVAVWGVAQLKMRRLFLGVVVGQWIRGQVEVDELNSPFSLYCLLPDNPYSPTQPRLHTMRWKRTAWPSYALMDLVNSLLRKKKPPQVYEAFVIQASGLNKTPNQSKLDNVAIRMNAKVMPNRLTFTSGALQLSL